MVCASQYKPENTPKQATDTKNETNVEFWILH